jgi:hypothetical protein
MPKDPSQADLAVYQAISARRLQWDNLIWQVPFLSLTAQAFLLTIELSSGTHGDPRVIAAALSLVTTCLSVYLMTRHRRLELMDSEWLEAWEQRHGVSAVHGKSYQKAKKAMHHGGGVLAAIPKTFVIWSVGLSLFGVVAIVVMFVTWFHPQTFG